MLDANLQSQLKTYLERVTRPIQITAHADDGAKSQEMLELLQTLESLSDKISLQVLRDGQGRVPSFDLGTPGQDIHLTFAGLPMGHEFTSLVLALLQVGGHPSKATAELIEQVQNLEGEYRFETYFSLSCQNCPDVVQALNLAAVLNPRIQHVAIDGALFQDEVEKREIMSVPTVYLNGEVFDQGRMTLEQIVAKLDTNASKRDAEKIAAKDAFDVLVVGGGPAGAAAAIYAARKGIRTGIAAERFGGQVLDTMAIENFISVKETEGPKLATALEQHVREYEVDIKRVAVIGGGNSGVEAAIDLAGIVSHVTLLEFDSSLRADEVLQKKLRSLANVTVLTSAQTTEVLGDGSRVTGLVYKDRVGGDAHRVELEGIFVQIGLLPNTEWLKDVVALSPRGEIVIDDRGQTNLPGVFAAGDCTTVPYKQIIIAMGAGSTAALSAFDHLIRSSVSSSSGAVAEAA